MKRLLTLGVILSAALLNGCGGGNSLANGPNNQGGGGTQTASVTLLASTTQLLTDRSGNQQVQLTAIVRDLNQVVIEGVTVVFSAPSGSLTVTNSVTDANGMAVATFSTTQLANATVTITATADGFTDSVDITLTGTQLVLSGPTALAQGQVGTYTVSLRDGQAVGVPGQTVDVTSATGNTISAASLTTDAGGQAQFTVTATQAGMDMINAMALGLTATRNVNVSDDVFTITAPLAGAEINLGVVEPVTVLWEKAGIPQGSQPINFVSTRGTLGAGTVNTDPGTGIAANTISSTNAGPATITVTNPEGTSASIAVEFVATTAATLALQAEPFTVSVGQPSSIVAVVRDATGNLVKNKQVVFELTDTTGGSLSVASDITDSQGTARTTYTGGSTASAQDGVSVRAFVQDTPAIENTVQLTVAGEELFIVLGTGNDIFEPSSALFSLEWAIIVTDVDALPVANKTVNVSVNSNYYWKGMLELNAAGDAWQREPGAVQCQDEDTFYPGTQYFRNGQLDIDPGMGIDEDFNMSGSLEAGNVAAVLPFPATGDCSTIGGGGSAVTAVTTNASGFARVCVVYPQDHNKWVDVRIKAEASVAGTQFSTGTQFNLPAKAEDFSNVNAAPPGETSPFGPDLDCTVAPP